MFQRTIINKNNLRIKFVLISVPIIFFLSFISHYIFEISGKNIIIAIFFPINESIFQHLKLCLYPTMFFWLISYVFLRRKQTIDYQNWIFSMIISSLINIYMVLSIYYIALSAFNIHHLFLDISSLLIGIILGQLTGVHLYNHSNINDYYFSLDYVLIIIVIVFTLFTFFPPKLPIFFDSSSNSYEFSPSCSILK